MMISLLGTPFVSNPEALNVTASGAVPEVGEAVKLTDCAVPLVTVIVTELSAEPEEFKSVAVYVLAVK